MFGEHLTGKILSLDIYTKAITLSVNFGFHGPPILTFKIDRSDLRALDLGKVMSFTHQLKMQFILYAKH